MQKSQLAVEQLLDKASDLYYTGAPIISDTEFDRLVEDTRVGHKIRRGIKHLYPMKSLQSVLMLPNLLLIM